MALSAATAWSAMKAAKADAKTAYLDGKTFPLSSAQVIELIDAMEEAAVGALFDHFENNAEISFTAETIGVGLSNSGGPVAGTLTVSGGTIE